MAGITAAQGRYDEALEWMQRLEALNDRIIVRTLPGLSEYRCLGWLDSMRVSMECLLSLIVRNQLHSPAAVRMACDLVLRRKAVAFEVLASQRATVRHEGSDLSEAMRELTEQRRRLSEESLADPALTSPEEHRRRIVALESAVEELEAHIARTSPAVGLEQRLRQATRASIAATLPRNAALVELVRFDFRSLSSSADPERNGSALREAVFDPIVRAAPGCRGPRFRSLRGGRGSDAQGRTRFRAVAGRAEARAYGNDDDRGPRRNLPVSCRTRESLAPVRTRACGRKPGTPGRRVHLRRPGRPNRMTVRSAVATSRDLRRDSSACELPIGCRSSAQEQLRPGKSHRRDRLSYQEGMHMTNAADRSEEIGATEETSYGGRTMDNGILVETKIKRINALHAVCETGRNGFLLIRYDRGAPLWSKPFFIEVSDMPVFRPVIFRDSWTLDALYVAGGYPGTLYHTYTKTHFTAGPPPYEWAKGWELPEARNVVGTPAVCKGGDVLDVVAPVASGGFRHWYRNRFGTWFTTGTQYSNQFSGLSMLLGPEKTLYVSAVESNGTLWWITRSSDETKWSSQSIANGYTGQPVLVGEHDKDVKHLVVPNAGGQLTHFEIDAGHTEKARFGVSGRLYREVGLVFNHAKQLECVARAAEGGPPEHYVNRFDGKGWVAGIAFPSAADAEWL
jgi:hypothetical protein